MERIGHGPQKVAALRGGHESLLGFPFHLLAEQKYQPHVLASQPPGVWEPPWNVQPGSAKTTMTDGRKEEGGSWAMEK